MYVFINAQVEVVPPPFLSRMVSRAQMGRRGGGKMPRKLRSNPATKHKAIKLRTPA
jgi:hypothetical protein